jgi:hypothetical protein
VVAWEPLQSCELINCGEKPLGQVPWVARFLSPLFRYCQDILPCAAAGSCPYAPMGNPPPVTGYGSLSTPGATAPASPAVATGRGRAPVSAESWGRAAGDGVTT